MVMKITCGASNMSGLFTRFVPIVFGFGKDIVQVDNRYYVDSEFELDYDESGGYEDE
jgi:hypothetical protein